MAKVNLDALIPREDFEIVGNKTNTSLKKDLSITDLKNAYFYPFLRKPDFQRETNEWDTKKIVEFVESFIEGELIPAIILWRSKSGYIFVIDGAHRLSALISWIYDDYGDGEITKKFYDNNIPDDQIEIAQKTRQVINKKVGSFEDIKQAHPNSISSDDMQQKAANIAVHSIQVQWVDGDARKAENSFFKINQKASKIAPTELKILESRKKPNCIAARAIIRAGKGHKYWSAFNAENQNTIQALSEEINKIFFSPQLKTPVKTLDIPLGGKISSAQTLPLILEFINMVNNVPAKFKEILDDDADGEATIRFLKQGRKIAWRLNSVHASSLGLHPMIYFYSKEGKYKTASFYSITYFIIQLIQKNKINDFIKARSNFEQFLLEYDYVLQQIIRKYRTALKALPYVTDYYFKIINFINSGHSYQEAVKEISKVKEYEFIKLQDNSDMGRVSRDFDTASKSAVFIKQALVNGMKCEICGGYIHTNSITIDHIERKEDGGMGVPENGQLAHPYCNSTYKN